MPAANVLNNATPTMNSVPWRRVCTGYQKTMQLTKKRFAYKILSVFVFPRPCLPAQCQTRIPYFLSTWTHMHAHISLNIRGEHPSLQWVTPGYASSLSPLSSTGSHTGGIWNPLAAESHRAIKPSKSHKRTRGRTSNNVGPTSCQQTQYILNLNKPHCSFFILPVSLYASLNYSSLSLSHKHHLGMNRGRVLHFYPYMELVLMLRGTKRGSGDCDRGETDTDGARNSH